MSTLFENYTGGTNDFIRVRAALWSAQIFTASSTHTFTDFSFLCYQSGGGGNPGTCTVSLRAVSSNLPTGSDLTAGTFDASALTTNANGEVKNVLMGTPYALTNGVQYAIVVSCPTGDASNELDWKVNSTGGSVGETYCNSADSGASWTNNSPFLFYYAVFGNAGGLGGTRFLTSLNAG